MMKKYMSLLAALAAVGTASAEVVLNYSFDDTANDTGPAFQVFSNNTAAVADLTTGELANSSSKAAGFNTVSSLDLSSYAGFTVEIVVDSSNFDTGNGGLYNGSFFGITTGPNANVQNGDALYNNVGTSDKPAIGVQFGDNGRGTAGYVELVVDEGAYSFTTLAAYPTGSMNDGFSLFLTFTDNGTDDAGVAITSTGLSTELAYAGTVDGFAYADFADTVTGNVSGQGSTIDMASYTIDTIPEPATLGLVGAFGGAVLFIRRRFRI